MAEIFNIDFETGDLTQFDSVTSGTLATFDASTDAVKTGTYGMRCIGAGYGHGLANIGVGKDDVYFGFHFFMDSTFSIPAWNLINFFSLLLSDFSTNVRLFMVRNNGSAGVPTHWRISDEAGNNETTTNIATGVWHWMEIRMKCNDASTGGVEVWIDGTSIYSDFTQDYSQAYIINSELGLPISSQPIPTVGDFLYFDNFITDDAGRVIEPTDGGVSIPVIINHLKNQGVL